MTLSVCALLQAPLPTQSPGRKRDDGKTGMIVRSMKGILLAFSFALLAVYAGGKQAHAGVEAMDGRLSIGGDILALDLRTFLDAFGAAIKSTSETGSPLLVELNSDGGDIETAFFMADAISAAQENGRMIQIEVPSGGRCNSACVVIFAAGETRRAAPDSEFLLHGVTYSGLSENPAIAEVRRRYVEDFHQAIEGADWQFGQFVRRHGIIENDLNMTFSGRQLFDAFGSFITSLNTASGN